MDKTGRNGIRVGDIELPNGKNIQHFETNTLGAMIENMKVDLDFDIDQLEENFFAAVAHMKQNHSLYRQKEFLSQAQKS